MVARALAGVFAAAAVCASLAGCGGAGVRDFGAVEVGMTRVQVAPESRKDCVRWPRGGRKARSS
ncbi:MAG TPA: hypothetical protein VJ986_01425 [Gaiellaceae bacterium]|nr:hypothetical protein [Gaiellaceae bacterium]